MTHRDAVIDRDRVKFFCNAACFFDFAGDHLTEVFEVNVTRNELGERVHDCDNRLTKIAIGHACGTPKTTGTCHVAAMGGFTRTVIGHWDIHLLRVD